MKRYVVDASVAAQWLIPEPESPKALTLIERNIERLVPDLIFSEIGNILWKRARRGDLSAERATEAVHRFGTIPLCVFPVAELMDLAYEIAAGYDRSFYDSTYLALAVRQRATLLTADGRLVRSLEHTALRQSVLDISQF